MRDLWRALLSTPAATLSAVAAIFSALSAFLVMRIQLQNLRDAARPEIIIEGWVREDSGSGDDGRTTVEFGQIRNIGRGPALSLVVNASKLGADRRPLTSMSTFSVPILAAGESVIVRSPITVWFRNVRPDENDMKQIWVNIVIHCWDYRQMRHLTKYPLLASDKPERFAGSNMVAPGLMLAHRSTESRPVWRLKLRARFQRVPLLGRLLLDRDV